MSQIRKVVFLSCHPIAPSNEWNDFTDSQVLPVKPSFAEATLAKGALDVVCDHLESKQP